MRAELPIVSFICTLLVLSPLPWHWRARNISTLSLIFWLAALNIIRGINSVIWAGNTDNHAPIWCDITTKLEIGAHHAYASSTVCIVSTLARISSPQHTVANAAEKRAQTNFEIFMCAVLPVVGMALHYIVQGHRFDIMEDFGCSAATHLSIPGISLRWLVHRRAQFHTASTSNISSQTMGRHIRMVGLSLTSMLFVTAMSVLIIVTNMKYGIEPWVSWDFVHSDWNTIGRFTKTVVPSDDWLRFLLGWYMVPLTSVMFFAFFGLGKGTKDEYARCVSVLRAKIFSIKPRRQPILPILASVKPNATNSTVDARPAAVELIPEIPICQTPGWKEDCNSSPMHDMSRPSSSALNHGKQTNPHVESVP